MMGMPRLPRGVAIRAAPGAPPGGATASVGELSSGAWARTEQATQPARSPARIGTVFRRLKKEVQTPKAGEADWQRPWPGSSSFAWPGLGSRWARIVFGLDIAI